MTDPANPLTMADLKNKVDNYREFATKAIASKDVFTSAVFHRDAINQIFAHAPDADAVRIYLMKDDPDTTRPDDVSYLMVPVKKEADDFLDQIDDGHALMAQNQMFSLMAPCIGVLCK